MKVASFYCPAGISLIFKIWEHKNPLKMGSTGVGFTVDTGVIVTVKRSSRDAIFFNGKKIFFPTVSSVKNYLTKEKLEIKIKSTLPLSCGFGLSGASSLTAAFAINKLLTIKKNKSDLTKIAHLAEIENRTGLGTVGTVCTGGFLLKKSPGLPVKARSLPFLNNSIYAVVIGKIDTAKILQSDSLAKKINKAADLVLPEIDKFKNINLKQLLDLAYLFAEKSSLLNLSKLSPLLKELQKSGIHASMAMLGRVIICNKNPRKIISNYPIIKLKIVKSTVKEV